MLTTKDLIGRMSPMTLASLIADLDQFGHQDADERETAADARRALIAIVGEFGVIRMVADAAHETEEYAAAVAEGEMDD